jgi:hypothetical protein
MASWYRRRPRPGDTLAALPSAWRYGAPASDTASASSSLTALTAAATRVKGEDPPEVAKGRAASSAEAVEAWAMYDQVGELRYVSNAIAGRMGQAELYVEVAGERLDLDPGESDPILDAITPQMVERLGLNLFVAGDAWLVGLPPEKGGDGTRWLVCSTSEVKRARGKVEVRGVKYKENDVYPERIWDPHPADWERADSPVLSALPVLRELVGLTQHVSAQIDSRLAGAGVYWIPNEILNNPKVPEGAAQQNFSENPVLNAIMNAMLLPMEDRSNAAAIVPLLLGAPGDWISKIKFDSFATPFDKQTKELREEAIRRLGLNLDAPPELLQGMGDANHWGMWLVRDEVIQAHVSPRLDLVCDGVTTGYYRPVLKQLQATEVGRASLPSILRDADPDDVDVRADVSGLVQRPNRLADASQLHSVNVIGDEALRDAGGFEESDAPSPKERAVAIAIQVATANPQLLDNMAEIARAVEALLDGSPDTGPEAPLAPSRVPGTLRPLQAAPTKPADTQGEERPLVEADTLPSAGSPV